MRDAEAGHREETARSAAAFTIYQLCGTPLSKDDRPGIVALVAIGAAGTAAALVAVRRRDVGA